MKELKMLAFSHEGNRTIKPTATFLVLVLADKTEARAQWLRNRG